MNDTCSMCEHPYHKGDCRTDRYCFCPGDMDQDDAIMTRTTPSKFLVLSKKGGRVIVRVSMIFAVEVDDGSDVAVVYFGNGNYTQVDAKGYEKLLEAMAPTR